MSYFTEDAAVAKLREGGVVAVPTETVYGLGADATNSHAIAQIFAIKGRPQFNPLISHVADIHIARLHGVFSPAAEKLAAAFWPGPLTLVLPFRDTSSVCELARAGLETIALRVPAHPVMQSTLQRVDFPIAAPSANISGRLSPTTAQAVQDEFGDKMPILDGGTCTIGLESTIVGFERDTPLLLRPGFITREQIETCLGISIQTYENQHAPTSPGQLLKHYAPNAPLIIDSTICTAGSAYLGFGAIPTTILNTAKTVLNLSETGNLTEAASNLFAYLRMLDATSPSCIHVAPLPHEGLGEAIYDRLKRGANG